MKKRILAFAAVVAVSCIVAIEAKIFVATPESFSVTTRQGLVLQLSNQMEGMTNNDAVAYLVVAATNKSRQPLRLSPEDFKLKDEAGNAINALSGREALKTAVDWNFERADGYVRIAGADLREVLRDSLKRYTIDKELIPLSLKPKEQFKEKVLFFPKLPKGRYTLELGSDKVQLQITESVYFVRPEQAKGKTPGRN